MTGRFPISLSLLDFKIRDIAEQLGTPINIDHQNRGLIDA